MQYKIKVGRGRVKMCDIDKLIKRFSNDSEVLGLIQLVKQYQDSELAPAMKYIGNTPDQQIEKIYDEIVEIEEAVNGTDYYGKMEITINFLITKQRKW